MEATRIKRCDKGFTLIEVMIALVIFSIGIISIASMQITSIRGRSAAIKYTEASQVAANIMEDIQRAAYSSTGNIISTASPLTLTGSNGEAYTATWTIATETTYTVGANTFVARPVALTVAWKDGTRNKQIQLTSMKAPAF